MSLMAIIKFGYSLVIVTVLLMIWASLARASEVTDVYHMPCIFQALCTCSKAQIGDLGFVTCNRVPILRVPSEINSSKVYQLELTGNGIRELEPQFFMATGLYKLAINQNPLESIHEEAFYGLDNSLWELELREDKLIDVPSRAIRYLQKLRTLDLTGNEITEISGDNFRGLENALHTLILAYNSIAQLPLDAFASLPMLETLDLRGNHLALIDSGVFRDGMARLHNLILADNQLVYIPYEELNPVKTLRNLDLSDNVIKQITPPRDLGGLKMSLDTLKLENNLIGVLYPNSFKYFNIINSTFLDGNPIYALREDAFRSAKIRHLSLRDCSLTDLSPASFAGLENTLQTLDLSENNLTLVSKVMLNKLDMLRNLNLRENRVDINLQSNTLGYNTVYSSGSNYGSGSGSNYGSGSSYSSSYGSSGYGSSNYGSGSSGFGSNFGTFQDHLNSLDISGSNSYEISMQDVRRMRSLRHLTVGKLISRTLKTDDFIDFGLELEELRIIGSTITRIETSAFQHVRSIKSLDLSENNIDYIDPFAFAELHSLTTLKMANGLEDSVRILPYEPLKALIELENLDMSNNKIKNVPDTSFHLMEKLKRLNLQDNDIDYFAKGTLQGDHHRQLESVSLSVNKLRVLEQHTFVDLRQLHEILLDDNQIEIIQRRAFTSLDNLKIIRLKGNRITEIVDEAFQNLPTLVELDMSFNRLTSFRFAFFDQVGSASALKVNVSHNQIVALTDSIAPSNFFSNFYTQPQPLSLSQVTVSVNVKVLDFSHNNISYIAPYYFRHADFTLTELYLSHNFLRNITREVFGSLRNLQYLDLSHNLLFHLEYDCFVRAIDLRIIDLSNNYYLTEFPVEVFQKMQKLTNVDLSYNRIRNPPDGLIQSPALERLDMSYNELSRLPTSAISPAAANNLVELNLRGNSIAAIQAIDVSLRFRNSDVPGQYYPEDHDDNEDNSYYYTIYKNNDGGRGGDRLYPQKKQYPRNVLYKSLAVLDLAGNHLVGIDPGVFNNLPRLRWLDISDNPAFNTNDRTTNVFRGLERRLFYLGMRNVSLLSLPSLPLPKLRSLDLSFNNLHQIPPDATTNLTRLRSLDLSYNDLSTVPVATYALTDLRWLSLSGNPITALLNSTLQGLSTKLEYLDVTRLRLRTLEFGVFAKMFALRTLKMTAYSNVVGLNIARMLTYNAALKNLYIEVEYPMNEFGRELSGSLPCKLNNITITGWPLKYLTQFLISGVHSKVLRLAVLNTSIEEIAPEVFWNPGHVRNLTLDLRYNYLTRVPNPARREWPNVPGSVFLHDVQVAGNPLYCDCGIGWIEAFDRKRRQYLCDTPSKCVGVRDDTRIATCASHYNRSLIEVISMDLDCGWGKGFLSSPNFFIVLGMSILTCLYI